MTLHFLDFLQDQGRRSLLENRNTNWNEPRLKGCFCSRGVIFILPRLGIFLCRTISGLEALKIQTKNSESIYSWDEITGVN